MLLVMGRVCFDIRSSLIIMFRIHTKSQLIGRHIVKTFLGRACSSPPPQFNSHFSFAKSGSFEHFTLSRIIPGIQQVLYVVVSHLRLVICHCIKIVLNECNSVLQRIGNRSLQEASLVSVLLFVVSVKTPLIRPST